MAAGWGGWGECWRVRREGGGDPGGMRGWGGGNAAHNRMVGRPLRSDATPPPGEMADS